MATNTQRTPLGGILVPAVTTFDASGELARAPFEANLRAHMEQGMSGALIVGSSGEAALLNDAERASLAEWARGVVPRDKWLLVGVGSESTRQTISRARDAHAAGADAVLVVAPHYYLKRMTEQALRAHYEAIADASPVPVLVYNIPVYAHLVLSPDFVHHMAQHQNVIGMKDSAGNLAMLKEYLDAASDSFRVLTGNGGTVVPALRMGAAGAILAIALYAGQSVLAMHDALVSGDDALADAWQTKFVPLASDIGGAFGPAGLKAAMDIAGLYGGPTRGPLLTLIDDERAIVRARLEAAGVVPAMAGSA